MRSMPPVTWPDRISGFRSGVINEIIDVLDSYRPISTRTIRHEWRSDGLASHGADVDGGGSAEFSGTAYAPNGHPTTGLNSDSSKAWVKFDYLTYTFSEETGPPSDPWGEHEVWYRKAYTAGDIVVLRHG